MEFGGLRAFKPSVAAYISEAAALQALEVATQNSYLRIARFQLFNGRVSYPKKIKRIVSVGFTT